MLISVYCGSYSPFVPYTVIMSRYTKANHQVYMRFERRQYWQLSFMEPGLERELPRKLTFASSGKILELARKGEAWGTLENRRALERPVAAGKGGMSFATNSESVREAERTLIHRPKDSGPPYEEYPPLHAA
jgi:hypothetical protein